MATTALKTTSDLKRRQWMREGLIDASQESYWTAFTGGSPENIIYQVKNPYAANNGHTVIFQYDAQLSQRPVEGRETAYGTGEEKKQFSSKIGVKRFRFTVDNGDKFDGADYGSLGLNEHSDSRNKLARKYQTWKDQTIFDAMQGYMDQGASHVIKFDGKGAPGAGNITASNNPANFNYNSLITLETKIRTSSGFDQGGKRIPLKPYKGRAMSNPCWLLVLDNYAAAILKRDERYQDIMINADMRGGSNKALSMMIGKIGNLMIMEAPTFFGASEGSGLGTGPEAAKNPGGLTMNNTDVEIAGMRLRNAAGNLSGQTGFMEGADGRISRGVLLGAGAIQMAMGKEPDYQMQQSIDYGINSESMCEVWTQVQKTILTAELMDNVQAKIANFDYGVIAVDITLPDDTV